MRQFLKKYSIIVIFLLCYTSFIKAQFVVNYTNGTSDSLFTGTDISFSTNRNKEWTFNGTELSEIDSVTLSNLNIRLENYQAPEYIDYYRSISDWSQRYNWNLCNVHDPSIMRAEDGYYYMVTTDASFGNVHNDHGHFFCRRSKNLVDWTFMGSTMSSIPSWVEPKLNEIRESMGLGASTIDFTDETQFGFWAPCIRKVKDGLYRMYYSITMPGRIDGDNSWTERSFIGMMETSTPDAVKSWVDKGYVLTQASDKDLDFYTTSYSNCYFKWSAIDPSYIITPEGEHWLIYGSWHSGIAAIQLDPETGMPLNELGLPWGDISAYGTLIYTRDKSSRWQASEGPEVVYRNGFYYLFMAYDDLEVGYNTRVARATSIDGPYYSMNGYNVTALGGTIYPIVTHPYTFSNGYGWVGISHCAVFEDGNDNWFFSSQGRLPANSYSDEYSNAIMMGQIRRIVWTDDDWPLVMCERYGAVPQADINENELIGTWENLLIEYNYQVQIKPTLITLLSDHTVSGSPFSNKEWSFDPNTNKLTIGTQTLYVSRETDWEAEPRIATIIYAGYSSNGIQTYWGKKSN